MSITEDMENAGSWLFRWRSYLPLLLIGLFFIALQDFHYPLYSHKLDQLWKMFCLLISFFGLALRMYTVGTTPKGTSGRNTKEQVAIVLNTTGIYSITRNPLYLSNFIICIGITLSLHVWWLVVMTTLIFILYYERIIFAEEKFLKDKFGDVFSNWSSLTPLCFPKFKNWKSSSIPFSLRKAFRGEYSGFFAILASMTLLELIENKIVSGKYYLDQLWTVIFAFSLVIYLTLRTLKKKTKLLDP